MKENAEKPKAIVPYVPFNTLVSLIERLKETTTPPVIDNSLLASLSGSARSQLKSALRFLNLIDSKGVVNENLRRLVTAYKTDDWKATLSDIISEAYLDVIGDLDLSTGTSQMLSDAFRRKGGIDGQQMLDKALRFYLAASKAAGLSLSPHFMLRGARAATTERKARKPKRKERETAETPDEFEDEAPAGSVQFRLPIPNRGMAFITIPETIDSDDWTMLKAQLDAYVGRLIKQAGNE